jgi:hypothetical protein
LLFLCIRNRSKKQDLRYGDESLKEMVQIQKSNFELNKQKYEKEDKMADAMINFFNSGAAYFQKKAEPLPPPINQMETFNYPSNTASSTQDFNY